MKKLIENKSAEKIVENKISLSHREISAKKLLFRLTNNKRNKSKSFSIYEKAKFSTSVELAYNNSYRKIDVDYDTTFNNRFKKANLLIDVPGGSHVINVIEFVLLAGPRTETSVGGTTFLS